MRFFDPVNSETMRDNALDCRDDVSLSRLIFDLTWLVVPDDVIVLLTESESTLRKSNSLNKRTGKAKRGPKTDVKRAYSGQRSLWYDDKLSSQVS